MSTPRVLRTVAALALALAGLTSCAIPGDSSDISTTESEVALPPPTNLTVTNVRSDRQDLNWDPSPGATKYVILRGPSSGAETSYTSWSAPPYSATHLTANTQYCWEVKNVDSANEVSGPSNEVCLTTPGLIAAPTGVTATATSDTSVNVSWSAVSGAVKYYVNQSVAGGAYARVGTVLSPTVTFDKTALASNTQYCYTVQAEDSGANDSAPSAPACATTFLDGLEGYWKMDDATGTTATDSSGFGRNATLSGSSFATMPKAPLDDNKTGLSITSSSSSVATTAAVDAFRLTSAFSIAAWVYAPAAGDVRIMGMRNSGTCGQGTFGWELSQTSATGLAFMGQNSTARFGTTLPVGAWTHVAVTFAGGSNGTMLLYINGAQVASTTYSASNNLSLPLTLGHVGGCAGGAVLLDEVQILSRVLTPTELANMGTVPPAPTSLMITSTTSTAINLGWTAPASGADKWVILRGTAAGNETPYTHAPNPPTTFNGNHLQSNTQYSWEVETVQHGLLSLPSNEVIGTTLAGPAAPTGVTATPVSQTRINIAWNAVTNATKYYVFISTDGITYTAKGSVLAPTTTFQAVNLTANTPYWFEVQAEDAGGMKSPMSAPAMATTLM